MLIQYHPLSSDKLLNIQISSEIGLQNEFVTKWVWTRIKPKSSYILHSFVHSQGYIWLKSPQNWAYGSRDMAFVVMLRTIEYKKEIEHYYWLYLKINISEFRLTLLDHNT